MVTSDLTPNGSLCKDTIHIAQRWTLKFAHGFEDWTDKTVHATAVCIRGAAIVGAFYIVGRGVSKMWRFRDEIQEVAKGVWDDRWSILKQGLTTAAIYGAVCLVAMAMSEIIQKGI
jgi:hypothetical protein